MSSIIPLAPSRSPRQQARVRAAWVAFESALVDLQAERAALNAGLAAVQERLETFSAPSELGQAAARADAERAQAVEMGISRALQSDDHEALALALQDNMVRGVISALVSARLVRFFRA
jgi:hypothetical protein